MAGGDSGENYGNIPRAFIQELNERADLVDIIGASVKLNKKGANHWGLCPFHAEKTPSFSVNSDKGFYHCFGCGAHGNALSYYRHIHNNDFVAAVEALAQHLGVKVPRVRSGGAGNAAAADLGGVLRVALEHWKACLSESRAAQDYLKKRGVTAESIERFSIAYAADSWDDLRKALTKYDVKKLLAAGLARENNGKHYDYFRHRIIFPIFERNNRLLGFGGRALAADDKVKYLNSSENAQFSKKRILYGLPQAAEAIRHKQRLIICEGYMDVVMLSQSGFGEAVATMGTAATAEQMRKAITASQNIVLAFDGDEAGQKGAQRALHGILAALKDGVSIRFLFLPQGDDPDSYICAHGAAAFESLIKKAQPLEAFILAMLERAAAHLEHAGRASHMLKEGERLIKLIRLPQGRYIREYLTEHLTKAVGVNPQVLTKAVNAAAPAPQKPSSRAQMNPQSALFTLLCCLQANPACIDEIDEDLPLPGVPQDAQIVADVLRKLRWVVADDEDDESLDGGSSGDGGVASVIEAAGWHAVAEQVRRAAPRRFAIAKDVRLDLQKIMDELRAHHQKQIKKAQLLAELNES